ncbi:MAG: NAD(P)/FAD-dependent oxidoreductase [Clostridia bacterium]|nr:NAD(P)/FAD-dependent oxidoreductase [Clostridia bacterium]
MAHILIVGGGVAGLAAGITARLNGHDATIYEKHFKAGGNLTGWDRGGYHIDNCIHWLTGTNPVTKLYRMWKELGALGDVDVHQAESLFTFEKNGQQISLSNNLEQLQWDMLALAPEDEKEIRPLIKAIRDMQILNGIAGEHCDQKSSAWQKVHAVPSLLKYYSMTTGELAQRFSNPVLQGFLVSMMSHYFSALAMIMVFATFTGGNGAIPAGGSCAMAERMEQRFLSLGGKLHLRRGVAKINTKGDVAESVTLEDGTTVPVDYVVVTSDPAVAFGKLLDPRLMPKGLKKQYDDPKMLRFSSFHCAFACDSTEVPFRSDMIYEIPQEYRKNLPAEFLMLREFSHEKQFAPEGKALIQTMSYCMEKEANEFIDLSRDQEAYRQKKQSIAADVGQIISEKIPSLRGKLQCLDVWTPATYRRYTGTEIGSYMSFILPASTIPAKISNRIEGLKNVLLATQWLQTPGGLPIAADSGITAIQAILKREKKLIAAK